MTENNNLSTIIDTIHTPQQNNNDIQTNDLSTDIKSYIESLHIDIDALSAAIDAMIEDRTPIKEIPKKFPNFIKMIIDFISGIFNAPNHKEQTIIKDSAVLEAEPI